MIKRGKFDLNSKYHKVCYYSLKRHLGYLFLSKYNNVKISGINHHVTEFTRVWNIFSHICCMIFANITIEKARIVLLPPAVRTSVNSWTVAWPNSQSSAVQPLSSWDIASYRTVQRSSKAFSM